MARTNFDFVQIGQEYQYKEDGWVAEVVVLDDESTDEEFVFILHVLSSSDDTYCGERFRMMQSKTNTGIYSGQAQLFEEKVYVY